jgi:hypothetical protein
MKMNTKPRNPKPERKPNPEIRNMHRRMGCSDFGLRTSVGFQPSFFGIWAAEALAIQHAAA